MLVRKVVKSLRAKNHMDRGVPVNVIFLILFTIALVGHVLVFRKNLLAGKKFLISAMVFGTH